MNSTLISGTVRATHRRADHALSKITADGILLLAGLGVEGDAHCGEKVKHRSRVAADPTQPNLRQVHLIASELVGELAASGYRVAPGLMGENITTEGLDLISLPRDTRLRFSSGAEVLVTGLRNPCAQLNSLGDGLMACLVRKDAQGSLIRRAGIMGIVTAGGIVRPGDTITCLFPPAPYVALDRV